MELVGRTVRKEFKGFGVFSGTVRSYDASTGYFEIVYEDGDSEELELSEVLPLMEGTDEEHAAAATCGDGLLHEKPRLGRKPKKRRRIERKRELRGRPGNVSENLVIDEKDLNENCDINNEFLGNLKESMGISENSNGNCSLNDGFEVTLEIGHGFGRNLNEGVEINGELNLNVGETLEKERGFDLNTGFNLNEEADFEGVCDAYVESEENSRTRECIDLNLDVNGDFDEGLSVGDMGCSSSGTQRRKCDFDEGLSGGDMGCSNSGTQRRKCDFDLNVDVYEETKDMDDDCVVECKDLHSSDMASESQKREICCDVEKKCAEGSDTNGSSEKVDLDINDVSLSKVIGGSQGAAVRDASLGLAEGPEKENSAYSGDLKFHASAGALDDSCIKDCCHMEVQSKDGLHEVGTTDVEGTQVDLASPSKQGNSRRKRRRQSDRLISTSEPVLRRSTRRGAAHNHVPKMSSTANDQLSSPAVSAVTEEKGAGSRCEGTKKTCVPPPKLQLPHSSQNLSLDEIPVLDLFAVYACLRSFSALLFLSPFELEDFVAALRCKSPSTLFDCIHFSILQTLRKHLEYLSNEGSESASNCLRSLNWDLLDLITWPIFMAEYLLIHGSGLKPGYVISQLKLFNSDYYKQPASVKVEVLRCLCDDMIEVEAIRSELSRRSLAAEPDMVFDRSMNMEVCKKRRVTADISGGSCLTEEIVEDGTDGNSDECCLCKMDGSLICCDGCPAAYHSKCVGITSDLLPEGDWYCPECSIDRHKPCIKPQKSLRGAELLGIDPHGRLFFSSCGYLLVSESCDTESSFSYYHRNDLKAVLEVLKTSEFFYSGIIMAICKHWDITMSLNGASNLDSLDISLSLDVLTKGQCPTIPALPASLASTGMNIVKNEADDVRKVEDNSISTSSGHLGCEVSKSLNFVNPMTAMECPNITSEGSAGTMQISLDDQNIPNHGDHDSKRAAEFLDHSEVPGKIPSLGDSYLAASIDVGKENNIESTGPDHCSSAMTTRKGDTSRVNFGTGYVNYYSFALTASSVAEELMHKSSEKIEDNSLMSEEDIVSAQMKAIVKKYSKFCWPSIQGLVVNARKEKCGWCFSCKDPTDDRDCLFNTYLGPIQEGPTSDVVRLQSKKNRKGHLIDVVCHILSMVDRLRGLVLGPWLNPHHTKHWHKIFLKTSDISSLKHLLLTLESNLHPLTLSTEWSRHVDSVVTMGSASHVVISSLRTSSKQGISRKRGRSSETESNPSLNAAGGLGIFWWRGGRLSRQVFNWKVLPCTLASKAARQAGCTRIPGILYPENSEYAKRSRSIAWRAAVDTASSVEQLAFLVRELDSNIKWDEIENTHLLPALDKESRKSIRLFKKVIIRRKCTEGDLVKYLLDFGKRRAIPDVVKSHGSLVDESSSERKKYWLSECYVPLHLLKNFEERRTGRKSSEMKSLKPLGAGRVKKSSSWKKGLSYLFSKAERSEYYRCGHCNKEVLIREAVSCRYCKGYFHKRHVKKSDGPITAECTYTCHRCHNGTHGKIDAKIAKTVIKRGKVQSKKHRKASKDSRSVQIKRGKKASKGGQARLQNSKKAAPAVPLRRSPRKAKCLYLQNKRPGGRRKGKQKKSKKTTCKRPERCTSWQKKRTRVYHSYWLNGLLLSRKPNDERVMRFREKNILLSSEKLSVILDEPKCQLCCEADCASKLSHVACEICGGWFHGDAVGLNPENIGKLIGFRCHVCCKRDPPICPHVLTVENEVSQLVVEAQSNDVVECNDEVSNAVPPLSEIACN